MSSINNFYPIDPNNDPDYNYNFNNISNSGVLPFGGNGSEQTLYNLISEMRAENNNIRSVPAFFEALIALGNNPAAEGNKSILDMLNGLQGSDGTSISVQFADMFVAQAFGVSGGDPTKTQNYISNILTHIGGSDSNPIFGQLRQELESFLPCGTVNGKLLTMEESYTFYDTGSQQTLLGYYNPPGSTNAADFVDCSDTSGGLSLFTDHLSGMIGSWLNNSNIKDQLNHLRLNMFDEVAANPTYENNPFLLVAMLVSMCNIDDDQSQQAGLADNTKWGSNMTKQISQLNNDFSTTNFAMDKNGTPTLAGEHNAHDWMASLYKIQAQLDNNSNATDMVSSASQPIDGIGTQSVELANGTVTTLGALYQQGDNADLDQALNKLATDPGAPCNLQPDTAPGVPPAAATGLGANQMTDNISALSKAFTSEGQTLTTKSGAMSQLQNQAETLLSQILTTWKKGVDASITAISQS
jgi:hypothetical protein